MKRTTMALLLMVALTGCRFIEQSRHVAANTIAAAVVRSLFVMQSGALAGPSSRPLDRPAPLALPPSPRPAAAVVVVSGPPVPGKAPAAAREASHAIRVCRARIHLQLDENGNASL
jgi:hypothetical protein